MALSGGQETNALDRAYETSPFQPLLREGLMKRDNLGAAFEMRAIEAGPITVLGERSGKASALPWFQPAISCL